MRRVAIQRRTITTLMVSSAMGYFGFLSVAAVVGLLAAEILGSDTFAGIPAAAGTLGTALAATSLALRSAHRGRRPALTLGYGIGTAGALFALIAGQQRWFWALVVAMALFGVAQASNLQSRFAAADLADEDRTARSISLVVWVGTIGAVLGPPAALWANGWGVDFGLANWVGPTLLGFAGMMLAAIVVGTRLRPDPLVEAGGVEPDAPYQSPTAGAMHSLQIIWPNPKARLAVIAMGVSQMAMVAVMTMTPLHMRDHGHAEMSTLVISLHVLGMFGLSPLIGGWADRYGRIRVLGLGAMTLGTGTVTAVVAGYVPGLVFVGLFLLGLSWSFALIAGSALLTESLALEERVGAQGFADVVMSLLGATAAFSSGFVKSTVGYHWLANLATVSAVLVLFVTWSVARRAIAPVRG